VILGVSRLSGVVSPGVEVVWFRGLTLFIRPTVYGYAVMLAAVLSGISLGSYLVTPFLGRRWPWLPRQDFEWKRHDAGESGDARHRDQELRRPAGATFKRGPTNFCLSEEMTVTPRSGDLRGTD
jgi:hypothetical protein